MMQALAVVLLMILGGLMALAGVVFAILRWKTVRLRSRGLLISCLGLFTAMACGGMLLYKAAVKTTEVGSALRESMPEPVDLIADAMAENAATPSTESSSEDRLIEIYSYSADVSSLPADYFQYFGFRDWFRWPLVYPYSLNAIDGRENGFISDERNALSIRNREGVVDLQMHRIHRFTFNKRALLAEVGNLSNPDRSAKFALFTFKTSEILYFENQEDLLEEAERYGITGEEPWLTIEVYDALF